MGNTCQRARPGYKKTPVGWLPTDWECRAFSDVFTRVAAPVDVEPTGIYREIGIRSHGKGVFFKEPVFGATLGDKRVFHCQPGTLCFNIVFAWEQAVAILAPECDGFIASHRFPMYKAKPMGTEEYYLWFFKSKRGKHGLTIASPGGAGRNKTLGQGELEFLYVPVPSHAEQRRIVAVLSTWDRGIEEAERLLALKEQRKRALMQQLLTGKRRFPGSFEDWHSIRLSDCVVKTKGGATGGTGLGRGIAYIGAEAIAGGSTRTTETPGDVSCEINDVVLLWDGEYAGRCANGLSGAVGSTVCRLRLDTVVDSTFLAADLSYRYPRIRAIREGSGIPHLPGDFLNWYQVRLPSIEEQHRIAVVLNTCDAELRHLRTQVAALKKQKKGLMQKLLTGQVRVPQSVGGV